MPRTPLSGDAPHDTAGGAKVGMLAAWGRYPQVVAEALRAQGYRTYCLGVTGHAEPGLAELCEDFRWIGMGKLGRAIRYFKRHGVRQAVMAGKFHKVVIYQPAMIVRAMPDFRAMRAFFGHFWSQTKDRKDDTLLGTIVTEFARDGITFQPATDYVPQLLVPRGRLTRTPPTRQQISDIEFGWTTAKELGRLDIGQSVTVKGSGTLAVEAIEGTDACIRRAGELCRSGGFTVVKVAKPQQDMRFDVPTIGPGTIQTIVDAGGRVLAIEADKTILLDAEDVIRLADRHRLAIVAIDEQGGIDQLPHITVGAGGHVQPANQQGTEEPQRKSA